MQREEIIVKTETWYLNGGYVDLGSDAFKLCKFNNTKKIVVVFFGKVNKLREKEMCWN